MNDNVYFAADKPEVLVDYLSEAAQDWFNGLAETSYLNKIERSWRAYYNELNESGHEISFGGESGEVVNLAVNHFANLANHIHVMVTGTRPAFQCRAINSDQKSLTQAKLGNGLLDYYMREKRIEEILKDAVLYAIVLGSGYIKLEWNATSGQVRDYLEPDPRSIVGQDEDGNDIDENGNIVEVLPIYEGDAEISLLSPYDVYFDSTNNYYERNTWVVCRSLVNKYDLAAKYPELREKILGMESVIDEDKMRQEGLFSRKQKTDNIYIKEFFHKKTEASPNGRYVLYLNNEIILEDTILPYRSLPLYRITPAKLMGTPFGYTGMFDLLPLQEMLNSMYSTAATNVSAFGIQSVMVPREAGVEFEQVGSGMQFIKYNAQAGGGKPEALQLTATSPEVYRMMELLERNMETLSGVNSVARGNPETALRSGNALALVQAQALQYISGLRGSYNRLLEDVGTGLLHLLQDYAAVKRTAAIAGINNRTEMRDFKSEDIKLINRAVVEEGNPLFNSVAGRTEIANNLLQMGLIDTIDKYLMVLVTGDLNQMIEGKIDNLTLIRSENEALLRGEDVQAIYSEKHSAHIKDHMELLNDVELKKDPELVGRVLAHIQEHVNLLRTTDPFILSINGEQALAPAPDPNNMGQGGGQPQGPAPQGPPNIPNGTEVDPSMVQPQNPLPTELPQPAQPAGVAEGILPPMDTGMEGQ